jgi:hypothetical protein
VGEVVLLFDADKPLLRQEWFFGGILSAMSRAFDSSKSWNDPVEWLRPMRGLLGRAA